MGRALRHLPEIRGPPMRRPAVRQGLSGGSRQGQSADRPPLRRL